MHDAVEPAAGGFGNGGGQALKFGLFGAEQIKADGKRLGAAGSDDFVIHFFKLFLMARHQHHRGAGSGIRFGHLLALCLAMRR